MSSFDADKLYHLLPAVYRLRDAERGQVLKALLGIIAEQVGVVEDDIARLYENWFIETCDDWVVPYIGDLVGARGLHAIGAQASLTQRARAANVLRYRRRKGTAAMLEQLARDTTGWPARAVEYFELLGTTQHLNHVRPHNLRTPMLRDARTLAEIDTPFDTAAHTADVRRIAAGRGKHNIRNVGLYLWRLEAYPLRRIQAHAHGGGRFSFSPLGQDLPLFNRERTVTEVTQLAHADEVPDRLRRRALYDELEARRRALVDGGAHAPRYFDANPVLRVFVPGQAGAVPPEEILVCDLTTWRDPPADKTYMRSDGVAVTRPIQLAVDPVLGRIAFPSTGSVPAEILVDFHYGFSSEVGGGTYGRTLEADPATAFYAVRKSDPASDTVAKALLDWAADGQPNAIVQIGDSATYDEALDIDLPAGVMLELRAANNERPLLRLTQPLTITAAAPAAPDLPRAAITFDGLVIAAQPVEIRAGDLGSALFRHCTLVPGLALDPDGSPVDPTAPMLRVTGANPRLAVGVERSIVGALALADTGSLHVSDSIVDGLAIDAIRGPVCTIERSTVFGAAMVVELALASNSLFTGLVVAERKQQGCARFSYLPPGSQAPRQYRCQPQHAVQQAIDSALKREPNLSQARRDQIAAGVRQALKPLFTDRRYGQPAYAQLHTACAPEIRGGAEDESEMGVFSHLRQPQRAANLLTSLDEYLRVGLEAGTFYVT